jgi:hypothetical protein
MSQLPSASSNQNNNLRNAIPKSFRIRTLAQVPESSLSFSLVLLFSPDNTQFLIQSPDFSRNFSNMCSVVLRVVFCGTNYNVKV